MEAPAMQFSIRAVLAITLLTGGICGLMFGVPDEYLAYALLAPWAVLPGALISALVYGRGYVRAFAIGGLPIAIPAALWALANSFDAGAEAANALRIVFACGAAIIFFAGATSVAIRWVLMPVRTTRRATPPQQPPSHENDSREYSSRENAIGPIYSGRIAAQGEGAEPGAIGQRISIAAGQSFAAGQADLGRQTLQRGPTDSPGELA
jgi:hypothetical protein